MSSRMVWWWFALSTVLGVWFTVWFLKVPSETVQEARQDTVRTQSEPTVVAAPAALPRPLSPQVLNSTAAPPFELRFQAGYLPVRSDGSRVNGGEFHSVAVADVTGDGRDDIVAIGSSAELSYQLYVYPQSGNGQLAPPLRYKLQPLGNYIGLTTADIDGNGVADVVVTAAEGVEVWLSGDGGVLRHASTTSTTSDKKYMAQSVVVLDIDNDGDLDLLGHLQMTYEGSQDRSIDRRSRFRVWYGDGLGGFSAVRDIAHFGIDPGPPWGINDVQDSTDLIADDFNADGFVDIAIAATRFVAALQQNPKFIAFYLNDGHGGLYESQAIRSTAESITSIDVDKDGRRDVLGAVSANVPNAYVQVFWQGAGGVFGATPQTFLTYELPTAALGNDLDGDGDDDVLLAFYGWERIGFHLQDAHSFAPERLTKLQMLGNWFVAGYTGNNGLAAGYLNGDHCKDVVVASRFDGLQVFSGHNCAPRVMSSPLPPLLKAG